MKTSSEYKCSAMSQRRKHVTQTLDKKYVILKHLEKAEKLAYSSKGYSVGHTTIYDIKKKKEQIESFFKRGKDPSSSIRKTRQQHHLETSYVGLPLGTSLMFVVYDQVS
ncbi:hypothetical protein J6590_063822 [Homalodisca vitripennis]|nr:hypothetical protein J6590_063822 [Homalodisca vitripennis]